MYQNVKLASVVAAFDLVATVSIFYCRCRSHARFFSLSSQGLPSTSNLSLCRVSLCLHISAFLVLGTENESKKYRTTFFFFFSFL